jgi:hypothetical protein
MKVTLLRTVAFAVLVILGGCRARQFGQPDARAILPLHIRDSTTVVQASNSLKSDSVQVSLEAEYIEELAIHQWSRDSSERFIRPIDTVAISGDSIRLVFKLLFHSADTYPSEIFFPWASLVIRDLRTGKVLQSIDSLRTDCPLCLTDVDMDGFLDLRYAAPVSFDLTPYYDFRLFDSDSGHFAASDDFKEIPEYTLHRTEGLLYAYEQLTGGRGGYETIYKVSPGTIEPLLRNTDVDFTVIHERFLNGDWQVLEKILPDNDVHLDYANDKHLNQFRLVRDTLVLVETRTMRLLPLGVQMPSGPFAAYGSGEVYLYLSKIVFDTNYIYLGGRPAPPKYFRVINNSWQEVPSN